MISIIVPVYNSAPFLDKCIQSLVDQTYRDIEIIIIDDGSKDDSPAILRKWANTDPRIRAVFKDKNSGVSDSRNIGLKMAEGEYIGFVDSDDWVEPEMYGEMRRVIQQTGADAVFGGYKFVGPNGSVEIRSPEQTGSVLSSEEALLRIMPQCGAGRYNLFIWDKIFRRSVLMKDGELIQFDPAFSYGEDVLWVIQILQECKSVSFWQGCSYCYRAERDGNTRTEMIACKSMGYCESALEANRQILTILQGSRAENNQLQRVLIYIRWAFRTAAMLNDSDAYQKYRKGYFSALFRWYAGNRSLLGLRWLLVQILSDARFQFQSRLSRK